MREDTWVGCTPDGKPPVVGQRYEINHCRKGRFEGIILTTDGSTWATVEIAAGRAKAICAYNEREAGESVMVRSSLCTMRPALAGA